MMTQVTMTPNDESDDDDDSCRMTRDNNMTTRDRHGDSCHGDCFHLFVVSWLCVHSLRVRKIGQESALVLYSRLQQRRRVLLQDLESPDEIQRGK